MIFSKQELEALRCTVESALDNEFYEEETAVSKDLLYICLDKLKLYFKGGVK